MTAMVAPQPYTRQHAFSTSRNLLNLDCSADLKSYRRDLGPGVQAKCFEKTSDTIRAQLDDHRAFLLRHRQSGQASGFPSPVPRLEVPQSHTVHSNNAIPPQLAAPNNNYHTASHPRPLQILSQPHAPQQTVPPSRRGSPVPGHIGTYPAGLRQALERCSQYGHQRQPGTVWEIITDTKSDYMDSSKDVVGAYESLQEANMQVANVFLFDRYYASDDEPTYEVEGDGGLKIRCKTDGSTGRYVEIYVESAPARRTLGPGRR
ncbi:hypothetical protein BU25DRAFT_158358 [Macroventuria anomochaeta]|uniref:Uncharacterized protein n=1 Tax=Macroventuria anomochaeta TaxID=301207 RepID=A0ACB6RRL8_9PLEO|nr:uncharacterized protein BU25DRAFT_158358 [Macroventuria anomochaeta]KAF2624347.1 hypothetical protein BU25DRAFT_158358 [Macroventuria anomochaeta]